MVTPARSRSAVQAPLVLVAEDHEDNRMIATAALRHAGFRVIEAVDGVSALEAARVEQPDVVVLDAGMPGLDGFSVARSLRADPTMRRILILMVTAHALPEDRVRAVDAGVDMFQTKPIGPAALITAVRSLLRSPGSA